jgi:hypothetical protein
VQSEQYAYVEGSIMDIQNPGEENPLEKESVITNTETAPKDLPDDDLKLVTGGLSSKPSETLASAAICISQL